MASIASSVPATVHPVSRRDKRLRRASVPLAAVTRGFQVQADITGNGLRVAVVAAKFNDIVTERLVEGCLGALEARGVETEGVLVTWVPGSFEIPVVARRLASSGEFDAVIAVGCIIQGETAHYDAVVQAATSGIANASEATGVPVIFGVLTCETTEQAFDRAGGKLGNKGEDFAASAVHMGNLMRTLSIDYQL